jgi:hypothetical protein
MDNLYEKLIKKYGKKSTDKIIQKLLSNSDSKRLAHKTADKIIKYEEKNHDILFDLKKIPIITIVSNFFNPINSILSVYKLLYDNSDDVKKEIENKWTQISSTFIKNTQSLDKIILIATRKKPLLNTDNIFVIDDYINNKNIISIK